MECEICGRKLKSQTSIERGVGPGCWKKLHKQVGRGELCENRSVIEIDDDYIPGQVELQEWLDAVGIK